MWRGGIILENPDFNRIHIGFHVADAVDCVGSHTIINIRKGDVWIIADHTYIGRGANICVGSTGTLAVGENFAISGTTSIVCGNEISIGKKFSSAGILLLWMAMPIKFTVWTAR